MQLTGQQNLFKLGDDIIVALLFFLFFAALFVQFPVAGHLAGNCDTWFVMAFGNLHARWLESLFTGSPIGSAMYPVTNVLHYGESTPLTLLTYALLSTIVDDDIWAIYVLVVAITATSSFGVYKLAQYFSGSSTGSFFAGFAFGCNNFWFSNIDDTFLGSYAIPAFCLLLCERYFRGQQPRGLRTAALLGGVQVYLSSYVFLFQTVALSIVGGSLLFGARNSRELGGHLREVAIAVTIYAAVIAPMFALLLYRLIVVQPVDPYNVYGVIKQCSLAAVDFVRTLPGNLLYPQFSWTADAKVEWCQIRRYGFTGFLLFLTIIAGVFAPGRPWRYLAIGIFGVLLSMGTEIKLAGGSFASPVKWLYEYFPFFEFIRVPLRALLLSLAVLNVFAAMGIASLFRRSNITLPVQLVIVGLFCSIHFVENVPQPLPSWEGRKYSELDPAYIEFAKENPSAIVLDLPSNIGLETLDSDENLYAYNREIIYMYYQSKHGLNIVNGVNGYQPQSRLDIDPFVRAFPDRSALARIESIGVTHVVFHKRLTLPEDKWLRSQLDRSNRLRLLRETDRVAIWEIVDGD